MPTIFSHGIFAVLAGKGFLKQSVRFWLAAAGCAMIPDADVVAFRFGVPYESMFGHRGFTHSIAFALLLGAAAALVVRRLRPAGPAYSKLFLFFAVVTFSHPFFDMLTDGGLGVALFAPFSAERYFFPWRPIAVSPIGARFFGPQGLGVILSEIFWVWLPAAAIFLAAALFRRFRQSN